MAGGLRTGIVVFMIIEGAAYVSALLWGDTVRSMEQQLMAGALLLVGWSFTGMGLVAWSRMPASRVGPLMVGIGLTWPLAGFSLVDHALAFTLGNLAPALYIPLILRLVVTFPEGRARSAIERLVLGSGYAVLPATVLIAEMLIHPASLGCGACPLSLLYIDGDISWRRSAHLWTTGISVALFALAVAVVVLRWRRLPGPRRHAVTAVFPPAVAALALFAIGDLSAVVDSPIAEPFASLAYLGATLALALWPLGLLVGLARAEMHRAELAHLAVALSTPLAPGDVQRVLSDALRDPSLELAYWLPDTGKFVDVGGRTVNLDEAAGSRTVTMLERAGHRVAALLHDPALDEDPALVRTAAATARLAIENDRLHARVRAQLSEVLASRTRIVDATDAVRRKLERDLHDGAQQRLVHVSLMVGLAQARLRDGTVDEARRMLDEIAGKLTLALSEIRELAHGIHPAILTNAGLGPALESLAELAPLPVVINGAPLPRLPARVEETAYFIVSEGIANTIKHAAATKIDIELLLADNTLFMSVGDDGVGGADPDGSGLRGLADRVAAVRGVFRVETSSVAGTRLRVELPCE